VSTLPELVCQYCSHRNTGADSRCAHCGAPLRATVDTVKSVGEKLPAQVAEVVEKVGGEAKSIVDKAYPRWQWQAVGVVLLLMVVAAVLAVRSCSLPLPSNIGGTAPVRAMPGSLRTAASCQPLDDGGQREKCVISATDPMLFGGIAGGREMTFYAELLPQDRLADSVSRWRGAGGSALVDGPVYAAIGPSATVWYADTRTGLRLETSNFTSRTAAQTFLSRAGLVR
jgi:DNA-directed RNA polymerase subunit RPC12/RpoP